MVDDLHAREERVEVGGDELLERDERQCPSSLVRDEARQHLLGHLHAREGRDLRLRVAHQHGERERQVGDVGERAPEPDRQRREHREDLAPEALVERARAPRRSTSAIGTIAMPCSASAGRTSSLRAARLALGRARRCAPRSSSMTCDGVRPSGPGSPRPASTWSCRPATRMVKNSSTPDGRHLCSTAAASPTERAADQRRAPPARGALGRARRVAEHQLALHGARLVARLGVRRVQTPSAPRSHAFVSSASERSSVSSRSSRSDRVLDRRDELDARVEVARHEVGRADVDRRSRRRARRRRCASARGSARRPRRRGCSPRRPGTPGTRQQMPRMLRSTGTPACDARYSAWMQRAVDERVHLHRDARRLAAPRARRPCRSISSMIASRRKSGATSTLR